MKCIGIAKFTMKRWVLNFQHVRNKDSFHVLVNRKQKKLYPNNSGFVSLKLPAVLVSLKPSSQLHSKKLCTTFPSFRIRNKRLAHVHVYTINSDCV